MSQTTIPGSGLTAFHASDRPGGRIRVSSRQVQDLAKRGTDLLGGSLLLLFLGPLLLAVAAGLRAGGGPVLYRHRRVGRHGRPFDCLKFRTMVADGEQRLQQLLATDPRAAAEWRARRKLADDPRVTRLGAFLRATSLDELPQLLNVLRGEMSLVGPRPVVQEELDQHYGPLGAAAYRAQRPGITGLWQISGRSHTSYPERVALDLRYAAERSFLGDLRILVSTVPSVLARRGAM